MFALNHRWRCQFENGLSILWDIHKKIPEMVHSAFSLVEGRETRGIRSLHEQIKVEVLWNVIYVNMIPQIEITNTPVLTQKTKRVCAI